MVNAAKSLCCEAQPWVRLEHCLTPLQECFPWRCKPAIACNRPARLLSEPAQGTSRQHTQPPGGTGVTVFTGESRRVHHCGVLCGACRRRHTHTHTSVKTGRRSYCSRRPQLSFQSQPISATTVVMSEATLVVLVWKRIISLPAQLLMFPSQLTQCQQLVPGTQEQVWFEKSRNDTFNYLKPE